MVNLQDGLSGKRIKPILRVVGDNEYDFNQNHFSYEYEEKQLSDIEEIQIQIAHIREILDAYIQTSSSTDGGETEMEKLLEKINEIDKKVAILEERTKRIDELPSRDEMKNIFLETLDNKNLATKSDVELQVIKARNTQILWTIGTVIAAAGVIIRLI